MHPPRSAHTPPSHLPKALRPLLPHLRHPLSAPTPWLYMFRVTCPRSVQMHPIRGEACVAAVMAIIHTCPTNSHVENNIRQCTLWIYIYKQFLCRNHPLPLPSVFSKWFVTRMELGQWNRSSECLSRQLLTYLCILHLAWTTPLHHPHCHHHWHIPLSPFNATVASLFPSRNHWTHKYRHHLHPFQTYFHIHFPFPCNSFLVSGFRRRRGRRLEGGGHLG